MGVWRETLHEEIRNRLHRRTVQVSDSSTKITACPNACKTEQSSHISHEEAVRAKLNVELRSSKQLVAFTSTLVLRNYLLPADSIWESILTALLLGRSLYDAFER